MSIKKKRPPRCLYGGRSEVAGGSSTSGKDVHECAHYGQSPHEVITFTRSLMPTTQSPSASPRHDPGLHGAGQPPQCVITITRSSMPTVPSPTGGGATSALQWIGIERVPREISGSY